MQNDTGHWQELSIIAMKFTSTKWRRLFLMSCEIRLSSMKLQISLQKHGMTTSNCWCKHISKALHPDKTQGTIFGPEAIREKSRGKKNPDAMEIDEIQKKEGKSLWYCQICAGKGFKNKSKTHNIVDYYNKSSNEDKCPHKTSFQKPSLLGPSKNKNQSFRV